MERPINNRGQKLVTLIHTAYKVMFIAKINKGNHITYASSEVSFKYDDVPTVEKIKLAVNINDVKIKDIVELQSVSVFDVYTQTGEYQYDTNEYCVISELNNNIEPTIQMK